MKLLIYLRHHGIKKTAMELGIATSFLSSIAHGRRSLPAKYCYTFEKISNGEITRKDLRPNDYHLIWHELSEPSKKTDMDKNHE